MKGMLDIIKTRTMGQKPAAVFVHLVGKTTFRDGLGYLDDGMFAVEIGSSERIEALDFRPLLGCWVILRDEVGDMERFRTLAKCVAKASPSKLQMPIKTDDGWLVHTLEAGQTRSATVEHL